MIQRLQFQRLKKFLVQPIRLFLEKELQKRIKLNAKLLPITEFDPEDIFIVGYPKSGNTWFKYLTASIVYGIDLEFALDTLIQEVIPAVYKRYYKRYRNPMIFVSHELPNPKYRRVIYILRDGRDVVVSNYHHIKACLGKEIDFLETMRTEVIGSFHPIKCKWHEHVEAWLSNPYHVQVITVKYENLKKSPVDELQRVCEFIGIKREKSFLESVAEKGSFEKMREREGKYGWDERFWPKGRPLFIRRGVVGSYKHEMPPDVLESFLKEASETLKRCGYLSD